MNPSIYASRYIFVSDTDDKGRRLRVLCRVIGESAKGLVCRAESDSRILTAVSERNFATKAEAVSAELSR